MLERNRRLLLTSKAETRAVVKPDAGLQVHWRKTHLKIKKPRSVQTSLEARGYSVRQDELFSVKVNLAGQEGSIVAEGPLAVVGPSKVVVMQWRFPGQWSGGKFGTAATSNNNHTVNWLSVNHPVPGNDVNAKNWSWDLFEGHVDYRILDQFDQPIIDAPHDGAEIMVREDVPLGSLVPPNPSTISNLALDLANLVKNKTTLDWKKALKGDVFTDHVNIFINPGAIMAPQPIRVIVPANQDFIGMAGHQWNVSIGKNGTTMYPRQVTNNNLTVQVEALSSSQAPGTLQTRAVYNVVLP